MGNAPRPECEPARAEPELLVADLEDVLAVEDVEELVLALVHVQRRVYHRRHFLEQAEAAAGLLPEARTRMVASPKTRRSPASGSRA